MIIKWSFQLLLTNADQKRQVFTDVLQIIFLKFMKISRETSTMESCFSKIAGFCAFRLEQLPFQTFRYFSMFKPISSQCSHFNPLKTPVFLGFSEKIDQKSKILIRYWLMVSFFKESHTWLLVILYLLDWNNFHWFNVSITKHCII